MMENLTKYIRILEHIHKIMDMTDDIEIIEPISKIFITKNLKIDISNLKLVFQELGLIDDGFFSYIFNYEHSKLEKSIEFNSFKEVYRYVELSLPEIIEHGGLYFHIVSKKKTDLFIDILYRKDIAITYLNNNKNKSLVTNLKFSSSSY